MVIVGKTLNVTGDYEEYKIPFLNVSYKPLFSCPSAVKQMAPTGFEPATPGLKGQYSNRTELRGRTKLESR